MNTKRILKFIGLKVVEIYLFIILLYLTIFIGKNVAITKGLGSLECEEPTQPEMGCLHFDSMDDYAIAFLSGITNLLFLGIIIFFIIIPLCKKNWEWAK